jgi:hypothetical protein
MSKSDSETKNGEEQSDDDQPEIFRNTSGPDREEMVAKYLPEQDDWESKTILDLSDPAAVAALSNFGTMFPEVDDLQPLIDDFLEHYLKSRTSVGGQARGEFESIFKAMYGQSSDDSERSRTLQLVAADDD